MSDPKDPKDPKDPPPSDTETDSESDSKVNNEVKEIDEEMNKKIPRLVRDQDGNWVRSETLEETNSTSSSDESSNELGNQLLKLIVLRIQERIEEYDDYEDTEQNTIVPIVPETQLGKRPRDDVPPTPVGPLAKYSKKERDIIHKTEHDIKSMRKVENTYRYDVILSKLSMSSKAQILEKLDEYKKLGRSDGAEKFKLERYINGLRKIQFDRYINIPVSLSDGSEKISEYLKFAENTLENCIYGQHDAKQRILQIIAQWISNPTGKTPCLGLHGPPGVGKTTLLKNGLAKALGRPFGFLTLGGMRDGSMLVGHEYTYIGSYWGRIVGILMESQCMNPIIFFDELDKVCEGTNGQEITGVLTHLTDYSQNDKFHDEYFSGIDFDLSRCLFVFSYNDPKLVDPILRDRLTTIEVGGFNHQEKIMIAKKYILPEILPNIGLHIDELQFDDNCLKWIIDNFTDEKGVRDLRRCLESIAMKINLMKLYPKNRWTDFKLPMIFHDNQNHHEKLKTLLNHKQKNTNTIPYGMYV